MIELVSVTGGDIGKSLVTLEQAQDLIIERFNAIELAVAERVGAAISRHAELNYDLKGFHRSMEHWRAAFEGFGVRLAVIEKKLGIEPFKTESPHIDWIPTAKARSSALMKARAGKRKRRLTVSETAWRKEAEKAATKLRGELPPLVNIPDLMRRFGVSRSKIEVLIGKGTIKAVRQGSRTFIPREEIAAYVQRSGILRPQSRNYGGPRNDE